MKKVTLKVLLPFHDIENSGTKRLKNEIFECSQKRAKEILTHKPELVKIISILKTK